MICQRCGTEIRDGSRCDQCLLEDRDPDLGGWGAVAGDDPVELVADDLLFRQSIRDALDMADSERARELIREAAQLELCERTQEGAGR